MPAVQETDSSLRQGAGEIGMMEDGRYCENCHPYGTILADRHDKDQFNKRYIPSWGVCDKCKLLKPRWYWVQSNDDKEFDEEWESLPKLPIKERLA